MVTRLFQTVTSTALLQALTEDGNEDVWHELDGRYRPLVFNVARRMGLGDEDAADAAQESLMEFFRDYRAGQYDRERGRLHGWLLAITRNRVRNRQRTLARRDEARGDSVIGELPEPDGGELEHIWAVELEEEILRRAFAALRAGGNFDESSLEVFEAYVIREEDPGKVASERGLSVSTVYSIKSRCLKRLAELKDEIGQIYDDAG
jgi:RNA polymerase sigma factor (sigma-70 family)